MTARRDPSLRAILLIRGSLEADFAGEAHGQHTATTTIVVVVTSLKLQFDSIQFNLIPVHSVPSRPTTRERGDLSEIL